MVEAGHSKWKTFSLSPPSLLSLFMTSIFSSSSRHKRGGPGGKKLDILRSARGGGRRDALPSSPACAPHVTISDDDEVTMTGEWARQPLKVDGTTTRKSARTPGCAEDAGVRWLDVSGRAYKKVKKPPAQTLAKEAPTHSSVPKVSKVAKAAKTTKATKMTERQRGRRRVSPHGGKIALRQQRIRAPTSTDVGSKGSTTRHRLSSTSRVAGPRPRGPRLSERTHKRLPKREREREGIAGRERCSWEGYKAIVTRVSYVYSPS